MDQAEAGKNNHPSILTLPDELLQQAFTYVPDESIFNLERVCRRFAGLMNFPVLWKSRCSRFKYWEPHHAIESKLKRQPASDVQWKVLYVNRCKSERRVTQLLNDLINSGSGRLGNFEKIAMEGYDAKDCLKGHLEAPSDGEDVLARRYYASEAISFIHRRRAIQIWRKLADSVPVSIEQALGAYDLYVTRGATRDVEQISASLDALAAQYSSTAISENINQSSPPRDVAKSLIDFMRREGFTGATTINYQALKNSFLGICIDSNRATLPLTTSVVFCALATRIGLKAKPCGLVGHVIVRVEGEDENGEPDPSFWDPYTNSDEIPPSALEGQLRLLYSLPSGSTGLNIPKYPRASSAGELVVRAAKNILESVRVAGEQNLIDWVNVQHLDKPPFTVERSAALYAALTASVICGPPASTRLLEHMCTLMQRDFPMDVSFFERDMFQMTSEDDTVLLNDICRAVRAEDRAVKRPIRRNTKEHKDVKYKIGTTFRHKRYGYTAVITGWTEECDTDENWIHQMNVDSLVRGRHQPFYNVFVSDGSSRYVAEDNITPLRPDNGEPLVGYLSVGKYFKRFDPKLGCFISNMKEEYPDD